MQCPTEEISQQVDFTHVYKQLAPKVYKYLYRLCQDQQLAEDLLQETFLSIYKNINTFRGQASLQTWVYTIATNKFRDHLRQAKNPDTADTDDVEEQASSTPNPERWTIHNEQIQKVRQAIQKLPPKLRVPLLLVRFEGMKYREAADILNVPLSTIRMRIYHSLRTLAKDLGNDL